LTADIVQFDDLDVGWVVEIGNWRIVEGDMAVDADPKTDEVDWRLVHQGSIAAHFRIGIRFRCYPMHGGERQARKDMRIEPIREACGRCRIQPDILVHMEGGDAAPVDIRRAGKHSEHVRLARSGSKDHAHVRLAGEAFGECGRDICSSGGAHVCPRCKAFDRKLIKGSPCIRRGAKGGG